MAGSRPQWFVSSVFEVEVEDKADDKAAQCHARTAKEGT